MSARRRILLLALALAACSLPVARAAEPSLQGPVWEPVVSAAWELKCLGAHNDERLKELFECPKKRRVSLAVVGQSGVSAKGRLSRFFEAGNSIAFHDCADPGQNTHDTGQTAVILDAAAALGVQIDLHVWQPGESFEDVAQRFREAGQMCDIVCFFQSFWGQEAAQITKAIRESPKALFVSPHVGYENRPTSEAPQGSACKPWDAESIAHFVLTTPLARRLSQGDILTPLDRDANDSEIINFIVPSHHANGKGGTCPSAGTATACFAYLYAVMPKKPSPIEAIEIFRTTATVDRESLTSAPEFDDAAIDKTEKKIEMFLNPAPGKQRMLDAPGVLHLYNAYRSAVAPE